jgi:DNA mismatch repair protein MutL
MPEVQIDHSYNPFESESKSFTTGSSPKSGKLSIEKENIAGWEQLYTSFEKKSDHEDSYPAPEETNAQVSKTIQLRGKYIITPVKSGLMLIDQRQAHIRILFDRYLLALENKLPVTQTELYPESIELNPSDYNLFVEIVGELREMGFDIEEKGQNTVMIKGSPAELAGNNHTEFIEQLIENYKNTQDRLDIDFKEKIALAAAKAAAINHGRILDLIEMHEIIDKLFACPMPNFSPDGKKIITILTMDELEDRFL